MAKRPIVEYPAKVLSRAGEPVTKFDSALKQLVRDMFETMYEANGVGLAAPQIGLSLRLFVIDCDGLKLVAANPEITSQDGEEAGQEGCLSIGSIPAELERPQRAVLRAQDVNGAVFVKEASGPAARCFLHETDHCDGILFIRHLSPLNRDLVINRFKKLKENHTA